jgi:signal transduction histidine kinase
MIDDEGLITALKGFQSGELSGDALITQELERGDNSLRAISAPALAPDGGVVGTVTVLEDITPFKELDEMKSNFVSMVAHELRSPLVAIRQQNSVILEGLAGPLGEKQEDLLSRGLNKIDGLLELINDLLDIAKIEGGSAFEERIPVDLGKIIEETIALLQTRAREQGIEITFSSDNLRPVQADPKRMEEIFSNLITNAINYSPEGGAVDVIARGSDGMLEIRVKDRGIGIDPGELPKIFQKFYRVKHPKTRQVMGTGLGLSIVKGIVEAHQGSIEVESVPDGGTTFKVLLPMIDH